MNIPPPSGDLFAGIVITDEAWARLRRFVARNQLWFEPPSDPWAFTESGERVRIWPSDEWWEKYWEKCLNADDAEWERYCREEDDAETQRPPDNNIARYASCFGENPVTRDHMERLLTPDDITVMLAI